MMFSRDNRTLWDDTKLGIIFGFLGGFSNAVSIAILMFEIAPMSANWGGMAKEIGNLDYGEMFSYLPLIVCFISGAYIGVRWVKKYSPASLIITEAALFTSIAFLSRNNVILAVAIGGLATGMQNGMTSYLSHHAVRTSHLTSTITDIGITLARAEYKKTLVLGSKTMAYICGAIIGVVQAKLAGNFAFVLGGAYLIVFIVLRSLSVNHNFTLPLQRYLHNE